MARPRTVTDAEILEATAHAVARSGPLRFTFEDVARMLGVTPPAIARRFGTKRKLLVALVTRAVGSVPLRFRSARAHNESPLEALLDALAAASENVRSRTELANSLAFLQLDLTDPDLHTQTRAYFDATRDEMRSLLRQAAEAGEIAADVDVDSVAHALEVAYNGALITWAIRGGQGAPEVAVRRDLAAVVAPYRRDPAARQS